MTWQNGILGGAAAFVIAALRKYLVRMSWFIYWFEWFRIPCLLVSAKHIALFVLSYVRFKGRWRPNTSDNWLNLSILKVYSCVRKKLPFPWPGSSVPIKDVCCLPLRRELVPHLLSFYLPVSNVFHWTYCQHGILCYSLIHSAWRKSASRCINEPEQISPSRTIVSREYFHFLCINFSYWEFNMQKEKKKKKRL